MRGRRNSGSQIAVIVGAWAVVVGAAGVMDLVSIEQFDHLFRIDQYWIGWKHLIIALGALPLLFATATVRRPAAAVAGRGDGKRDLKL